MRYTPHVFLVAIMLGLAATSASAFASTDTPGGANVRVGLVRFGWVGGSAPVSHLDAWTQRFRTKLAASKALTIVEAQAIDSRQERVAQAQPKLSAPDARRIALKELAIAHVCHGYVVKAESGFSVRIDVRGPDLGLEWSAQASADSESAIDAAVDTVGAALQAGLPQNVPPPYGPQATDQLKPLLAVDDDEWKVLEPRLVELLRLHNDLRKARVADLAAAVSQSVPSTEWDKPAPGAAVGDLVGLLKNERPDSVAVKAKLDALRATRVIALRSATADAGAKPAVAELVKRVKGAQDALRPFLTSRQEAALVVEWVLE